MFFCSYCTKRQHWRVMWRGEDGFINDICCAVDEDVCRKTVELLNGQIR